MEILANATWQQRMRHLTLNALVFGLCYQAANALAVKNNISREITIALDNNIPFVDWMILPYFCSAAFFVWSFFKVGNLDELRVLSQRVLLATVIASLVFVVYPLRITSIRPSVNSPLYAVMFDFLRLTDRPYNQFPSLHIAYGLIFWSALYPCIKSLLARGLLAIILILMAVSTIFTFQHHLLDVVSGLVLGMLVIKVIAPKQTEMKVGFYYAMAAAVVFIVGVMFFRSWLAAYLVASLLLVSFAYIKRNRFFLNKKSGRHSVITWFLYAPYLLGYWLTWRLVQFKERRQPAIKQYSNQVWLGRRLNESQTKVLPENCVIIDLSPEIAETRSLLTSNYWHYPLLDLVSPDLTVLDEIASKIRQEVELGKPIYLHCAMGYQRCLNIAHHTYPE